MDGATVSAGVVGLVGKALEAVGVSPGPVLSRFRLRTRAEDDPCARLSYKEAARLFDDASRVAADPAFGLHAAERLSPGAFGVIDHLVRKSLTLGGALERASRYQRLLQDARLSIEIDRDRVVQRYRLWDDRPLPPRLAECVIAGALVWTRQTTGEDVTPLEVRFTQGMPGSTREHDRLFRAPLRFGSEDDALVLSATTLDMPLVDADPTLLEILEEYARLLVERLPPPAGLAGRVRELVRTRLATESLPSSRVAGLLLMSPRTLRRRLRGEGTSYEKVVDELRRRLAHHYLVELSLPIGEVSFRLGFFDASAFHKAFRRWFATTPGAYRRRCRFRRQAGRARASGPLTRHGR
jgi:AraC-like DNA-binding protein